MSVKLRNAVVAAALAVSSEAHAVEDGVEDRATSHAVAIARGTPSAASVECSGTLISANVVLTARHCIAPVVSSARACDVMLGPLPDEIGDVLSVNVAPWTIDGARWKKIARARVPEPTSICGDDIALLVLSEPVPEAEAIPARPVLDRASFLAYANEHAIGLAGFGVTDPRANDSGTRRSRFDIPIRCLPGEPGFACGAELDRIDLREITTGAGPCRGDSGGGAMPPSDRGVVLGVLSRGEETCSVGVFVRTDPWAWLIARTVLDAASPRAPAPEWATALFPTQPRAGDFCVGNGSCGANGVCASFDDRRSFVCADRCSSDADCAADRRCEDRVCAPAPSRPAAPDEAGGCSMGRTSPETTSCAIVFALTIAIFSARRGRSGRSAASSVQARSAVRSASRAAPVRSSSPPAR